LIEKIKKYWFLIGLVTVFASVFFDKTGLLSLIGVFLKKNHGPDFIIFIIFFLSGVILEIENLKQGIKDIKITFLTLFIIFIFSPIVALLLIKISPVETGIIIGIFLVAVMPTTLSSGVVMTQTAGGNMAHALFITVLANFISIVTIPFSLAILLSFLGKQTMVEFNQIAIIKKLCFLVLFPMLIGMNVKIIFKTIKNKIKQKIQITNQIFVILMIFIAGSGTKKIFFEKNEIIFKVLCMVILFHILLLCCAFLLSYIFKIKKGKRESLIFMGSQKTLPLSVILQLTLFPEYKTALLVCVMHHIIHLIIDGYIAVKLGHKLTILKND